MENELLCKLVTEIATGMAMGERAVLEEAVRRLRIGGENGDRIVVMAQKLMEMRRLMEHIIHENSELKAQLEYDRREVDLHVHYDLEAEGLGAVLQEGQNRYSVSALALAELLTARRDGRLVILQEDGR